MKGKFNHMERRGLPGGPNELFTYVTGVFSVDGYRNDSPDVNNPFNVIPSGRISMREHDGTPLKKGPILGIDNLGNEKMMQPGKEYQFPGEYVTEIPQVQFGGMSRRKIDKILNANKDLNFVQRLYQENAPSIMIPGQTGPSTHFMESADGKVYPTVVQMPDGTLQYLGDNAYNYAMETGEYIQFPNDRQARRFGKSYKKGTGVLQEFVEGGEGLPTFQKKGEVPPFIQPPSFTSAQDATYIKPAMLPPELTWTNEEKQTEKAISSRSYSAPNVQAQFAQSAYENMKKIQEQERQKKREEALKLKDYTKASSEEIGKLQTELIKEGYSIGNAGVDKKYGPATQAAYRAKVEDDALDISAIDRYYNKYKTQGADNRVAEIQRDLVRAGFLKSDQVDGRFGNITKAALERYNRQSEGDPQAVVFNNPPSRIKDTRCAAGMCKILEAQDIPTKELGMKFTNAWDMVENMNKAGNSKTVYNIYDNPQFKNVKNTAELKAATNRVKKSSQTTADMYKVGDVVGLYYAPSSHHSETLNSKTHNTHVGWVQEIVDGVPIIAHNINGKIYQQPYNQLTTTWIQRPDEKMLAMSEAWKGTPLRYNPATDKKYNVQPIVEGFERKIERKLNPKEKSVVANVINRAHLSANSLVKELKSSADPKWVEQTVFGITGAESAAGLKAPRSKDDMDALRRAGHIVKGTDDSDISYGVSKIKYSGLDPFAKEYFQINSYSDLADDNKSVDVTTYNLIKAYETYKDYAEKYPELGLKENDIRNMAVLAHNQGIPSLLKTGRSDKKKFLSPQEEVQALRALYTGTVKDVTSTNWRHLGDIGQAIFNTIGDASETYISKVNRYANEVYTKPEKKPAVLSGPYKNVVQTSPSARLLSQDNTYVRLMNPNLSAPPRQNPSPKPPALSPWTGIQRKTGGLVDQEASFKIYKSYINGDYMGTPKENWAKQTYDRLNRIYYKDAKDAGMSVPNYIMTNVLTLQ